MNCGERNASATDKEGSLAAPGAATASPRGRRPPHQQRGRDQQRPCNDADRHHRGAPVIGRNQPARERRNRHRRHAHAGGDQRHRKAAIVHEPAGGGRDHRGEERAGSEPHHQAVSELELHQRRRAAGQDQAEPEQHGTRQNDQARPDAIADRAPGETGRAHHQKIECHRARYARARPAGFLRHRLQIDSQRKHRADADAGHQCACRNDDPAIGRSHGSLRFFHVMAPRRTAYPVNDSR